MQKLPQQLRAPVLEERRVSGSTFTLIELLVVLAIIAIPSPSQPV